MLPEGCIGCDHIKGDVCTRYAMPQAQWDRVMGCAMRSHNRIEMKKQAGFVDPLPKKMSKRRATVAKATPIFQRKQ
ncbi:MAG: hypothetical protein COZ69_07740 [Deltaproteobacteria bacterium CG_4_8_14_3_um_filter_45_9]|nr:MAG: hypothetical protein COZ69_07740 [Deltaproteobacteria bacterium CG_4_8_14_3_um_filter_45_9]